MTYVGNDGSHTPLHIDLCGSVGHNLALDCAADPPGYSTWVIFKNAECTHILRNFIAETGKNIEDEQTILTVQDLSQFVELKGLEYAPFIWRQQPGDLMLIPPASGHFVVNIGGITAKLAWSMMSLTSLKVAFRSELEAHRL